MIRRPPRSTLSSSSAASDVYKRQGKKNAYRLYDKNGSAVLDYLCGSDEEPPQAGKQILCRHPFDRMKRVYVTPHRVESLLELVWDNGKLVRESAGVMAARERLEVSLGEMRDDHKRSLNPTPYKVSLSEHLYDFLHKLMEHEAPIKTIA
eukprot:TRINITY_DN1067_c0_g1_i4.p1 TRINITY_DN1067_c0_g1~~TRINITY_DN1067_c0_g1_i4.p1  ORF type:complete len:150 (+),score=40.80 TRINITY_DN1067_c0_g1_i4:156-605(+)